MASVRIKGGPQLKARLAAIPAGAPDLVALWAEDAASRMQQNAPSSSRPESRKFSIRARGLRAAVYGAYWWIFVDRGTKRHTIYGSGRRNPPDFLKFTRGGQTIFAKKVNHPGQRRRAFITRSAQEAFQNSELIQGVVKLWNRRRFTSHKRFI